MPKTRLAVAFATALFTMAILTGCTEPSTPTNSAPTVEPAATSSPKVTQTPDPTPIEIETAAPSPAPTPASTPAKSVRGNLTKQVGERFGLTDVNNTEANFVVTAITVNPTCTGDYASPAENGVLLKVDIQGTVDAGFAELIFLGAGNWKVIASNGTTFNGYPSTAASFSCLADGEMLRDTVGAGENINGSIILDVPTESGVIILGQPGVAGGWEWAYGQ